MSHKASKNQTRFLSLFNKLRGSEQRVWENRRAFNYWDVYIAIRAHQNS